MFMTFASLLIACSAQPLGGNLRLLGQIKIRRIWLIIAALVVQILITAVVSTAPRPLLAALHLATYLAVGVAVWANRALPGFLLIGIGAILNGTVIALNGGTLPASSRALAESGFSQDRHSFANSGLVSHPILPWLGDTFSTPSWLPFRNVISVGDILILIGAAILVHAVTQSKPWRLATARLGTRRANPSVAGPLKSS
jgi:hypothetical protein